MCLNKGWEESRKWIEERAGKLQKVCLPLICVLTCVQVEHVQGYLTNFLVEPFVPHPQDTEYYININSVREGDNILFYHEGGVDVGDVDAKASKLVIGPSDTFPSHATIKKELLSKVPAKSQDVLVDFIVRLYSVYVDLQFTYLEINPLVVIPTAVSYFYITLTCRTLQKYTILIWPQNSIKLQTSRSVLNGPSPVLQPRWVFHPLNPRAPLVQTTVPQWSSLHHSVERCPKKKPT